MQKYSSCEKVNPVGLANDSSRDSLKAVVKEDPVMDRRVWRKLDLYILPVVAMFYFLSFLVCKR